MDLNTYTLLAQLWIAVAVVVFIILLKITAPYGRHTTTTWGLQIDNKLGWFIMEFFVLVVLYSFLFTCTKTISLASGIMVAFFTMHYVNRSIIFPLRIKTNGKKMPVVIMFSAMGFNLANGFLIGYYFAEFAEYSVEWLYGPQFIIGTLIFFAGMFINWWSDNYLIQLRKPGETGYKIPKDGLFRFISCPNLFGEIVEWAGFAILTWSLPGVTFFIWTFANLVPRAIAHHKWYQEKFPDYPKERKAVIPFLL